MKPIEYVSADDLPHATPGKPGGVIAVAVDDFGREKPMTATQYHEVDHRAVLALDLWKELRFLRLTEMHPDDFRTLYPSQRSQSDEEIRETLKRADTRVMKR